MRRLIANGLFRLLLWGAVAVVLFPVFWVVLTSVKPPELSQALPPVWNFTPTLQSYSDVLGGNTYTSQAFGTLMAHSLVVTVASTLLGLIVGVPAAYALARFRFRGKKGTANWILSTIMFPPAVSVVPIFILASKLNLTDTFPCLIVPYAAFGLPMVIWMLRSFIKQIPYEIEEAATVDGASQGAVLWHIVFPLLMPGIVAASLLSAMLAWNEFLFALTLTRSAAKTAPVGISEFTNMYGTQWGSLTAAATVTVAPILVATMLLRRRLVEGLTFGAVK
ncbi:carbohydrate ABC transporter permease [Lichenifustis flavocetrariae]|uniref:Carbohydrate ABC transporter permease n=1 Tax=Lichenifustis flavocetrariae TaxID=2949735 RepID=A0AA42CIP1_9HYPH|nr:carbohydrate ABC transporter permease [Lichenifustis flavocetrariae]MCW6508763.1 carbohydrate ABC transporter permease [Lichenifustis flavocetrariae]